MSKMIQIRNVPDEVHRRLKARAAMEGRSLSDFLLSEITRVAETPDRKELFDRLAALPILRSKVTSAELIREDRDRR